MPSFIEVSRLQDGRKVTLAVEQVISVCSMPSSTAGGRSPGSEIMVLGLKQPLLVKDFYRSIQFLLHRAKHKTIATFYWDRDQAEFQAWVREFSLAEQPWRSEMQDEVLPLRLEDLDEIFLVAGDKRVEEYSSRVRTRLLDYLHSMSVPFGSVEPLDYQAQPELHEDWGRTQSTPPERVGPGDQGVQAEHGPRGEEIARAREGRQTRLQPRRQLRPSELPQPEPEEPMLF